MSTFKIILGKFEIYFNTKKSTFDILTEGNMIRYTLL